MKRNSFAIALLLCAAIAALAADPIQLPNGLLITPAAVPHSVTLPLAVELKGGRKFALGQAVTTSLSPDGARLLVLTSGYNKDQGSRNPQFSEYVLLFDLTVSPPRQIQALPVPNAFCGLAWNPNGNEFYVSGGVDDKVYVFEEDYSVSEYKQASAISLGHTTGLGLLSNAPAQFRAAAPKPMVAGIGVNRSGTVAVVANFYNDSLSLIDLKTRQKTAELDLRPGISDPAKAGVPGGEYPYWVAVKGNEKAYVSSPRDREIVIVSLDGSVRISGRIPVTGQPNRSLLNRAQDRLFVAADNSDTVEIIDTNADRLISSFGVVAPAGMLPQTGLPKGANPNSLALSPDESRLYVTDGGTNAIAVIDLQRDGKGSVAGLIPTGWYPNSVSLSLDGKKFYVVNAKSVPGPNAGHCRGDIKAPDSRDCKRAADQYVYTLENSSLMIAPVPPATELAALTARVAANNHFDVIRARATDPVMTALRQRIRHVIYIVKENRTYDQILGDLDVGDGDPALAEFPESLTPNHHALARRFVTLDNFYDSGEVSGVGWNWSTAARTTDYTEKTVPPNYAGRGFEYDWEGTNRNVNVGIALLPERLKSQPLLSPDPRIPADPNLLPGNADVAAPDSAAGEPGGGYIWDEALRAGLTVRNYGFFCDQGRYENPKNNPAYVPNSKTPFADKIQQAFPTTKSLLNLTDLYFRSFDQNNADYYLFKEWEREFDQFVVGGNLPNLTLLRLPHDHFGEFGTALYGLNTPALQIGDNDYAIGLVAQKIANSPYKDNTLIFIIEDDAQDGPDHVDAHRSVAYVIGPHVKQGVVVSEKYTTVSMIRTMEDLLGVQPSGLYAAGAAPMREVFDLNQAAWNYTPIIPALLRNSQLPLPPATAENSLPPSKLALAYTRGRQPARYWQKRLGDMDYDVEDKLDTPRFNRELWKGLMNGKPYPQIRSGANLRENRQALLAAYGML
jgi:DNA-binding beta-propeller fold protein YncE